MKHYKKDTLYIGVYKDGDVLGLDTKESLRRYGINESLTYYEITVGKQVKPEIIIA